MVPYLYMRKLKSMTHIYIIGVLLLKIMLIFYKFNNYWPKLIHICTFRKNKTSVQVSYCHHFASVVRRPSYFFFKNLTLKLLNHLLPNFIQMINRICKFKCMICVLINQPRWRILFKIEHRGQTMFLAYILHISQSYCTNIDPRRILIARASCYNFA